MVRVPRDILPGEETTFYVLHSVEPRLGLGGAVQDVSFNLVEQNVTWFEHQNVESLVVQVAAEPAEGSNAAGYFQIGSLIGSSFYLPSGGVTRGASDRPYPLFLREAAGCRVRDGDGNEWIDYVMGWGSALLGYAHPEIREAVAQSLCNGAILSLPTELEIEVAYQLGEMIPNAQKVLFGKNGSDVCTAAVRLARVKTGRPLILFSGYSGWQEPFAPVFEKSLHDPSATCRAIRFAPNDLAEVSRLFEHHPVQIAGVILEPAAQVEGVDGPVQVADAVFLRSLKLMCQAHGTVLIFDEIMTGFRHPGGNVQNATGVTPDLACFGKALTSGMPLAALVGQREVMDHVARIFYHPTFKSDAYSLAAARAALQIYQREDIPAKVASFGERLRAAVAECSVESGMDGELVSPPYRMVYRFNEPDLNRRTLLRTLLHRELLARGILTFRGFMLPSAAHGDAELERTVDGFRGAFAAIRQAAAHRSLVSSLEIPPVV
ncbi:aminotransferase class III-fold pyridoxal phosphate-dependent enzyme [Humisphaera borealis]|uniref:Aminotransferase class III-fold pyridoxal phosphate-dependent enzyme n=1 Tax=Humisphaera borealis TaxID=2807512 RepID=A0A7M2X0H4_9BACT|nr:aminotransferase class III-fold pyridoxal phosphate-dependent enzyme [Humisphaera borealis]QOV90591.1 aminotransferase class III-fold pyridoxal phosphate-dependent enzyme [Humisphaera borealis]